MAVLSKTFVDKSVHHGSLENEISFIGNKLFFETFPNIILHLQAFCSPSSCLELHYLLNHHLHRDIDGERKPSVKSKKHLVTVSQISMTIAASVSLSFQKMRISTSAVQQMAKENNVLDCAIAEMEEIRLKRRKTYIL